MKLTNVWVVEGGAGNAGQSVAAFHLRVEPNGWTLTDAEEPSVQRLWTWVAIGGLAIVRGSDKTPDGLPATALDVIVNGWPVRILVPTQDLPTETIAMLGAFAPVGHPLRASPRVTREPTLRRFTLAGRRFAQERLRARPVFLLSAASTRVRSALVVGLVLVVTVVVASIAGVATSAPNAPTTLGADSAHGTTTSDAPEEGAGLGGATTSSQAAGTTSSSSSSSSSSAPPAVAAARGGRAAGVKATRTGKPASGGAGTAATSTTKSTTPTKPGATTTTQAGSTTTATTRAPRPTTTTTRAPRPTTTTTRAPRPTTTTTSQPPVTTTQPPVTTTQPPVTTTQPPVTTTTS